MISICPDIYFPSVLSLTGPTESDSWQILPGNHDKCVCSSKKPPLTSFQNSNCVFSKSLQATITLQAFHYCTRVPDSFLEGSWKLYYITSVQ